MNGIKIGLPKTATDLKQGSNEGVSENYQKALSKIRAMYDWNKRYNLYEDK